MTSNSPPETEDNNEIIKFFPTVEFLKSQAEYMWQGTETYYIGFSKQTNVNFIGDSSSMINTPIKNIIDFEFSKIKFGSNDIDLVYSESTASFNSKISISKKSNVSLKSIKSIFISKGTDCILGSDFNPDNATNTILSPFTENINNIAVNFFETTTNSYYLGLAKNVELITHSSPSSSGSDYFNFVFYNSTSDFLDKSISSFESGTELASYTQLTPLTFELGTIPDRPCFMINYGTSPISVVGGKNDLLYDCLFIFKASEDGNSEGKNLMVCYAAQLDKEYYIFGIESSKAMFDESLDAREITEHNIKTELAWEVVII